VAAQLKLTFDWPDWRTSDDCKSTWPRSPFRYQISPKMLIRCIISRTQMYVSTYIYAQKKLSFVKLTTPVGGPLYIKLL